MQKEVERPRMFFPLLQFFTRAARSAIVHANFVHLLVNLRGISQIFPLCETLCYDALFGTYAAPSSACGSAAPPAPFSLFSLSDSLPFLREGLVWRDAGKAAGQASCLSVLSSDESAGGVARWCWWLERGRRGPGFGPHGWVARVVLLSLFFAGTAAGNVSSLLLRRWWSRVEWSVEKQTRDEEAQRRFWGGKVRREDLWLEQMELADAEKPRKNADVWTRHRRLEKVKSDSQAGEVEEETDARERENDRSWCVRTLGCSAGLYALLGTLVGSARIHTAVKRKLCGQMARRIFMELFAPVGASGLDEPGHVGGFLFGCLVAGLLGW
ncbi:hypothetical protein TGME49_244230 [Toxoplasma gondii ME49]|uniref:Uncharacterized protein n=1 Tax=Toxoplasma gondii (strain ATCC 50611 / Me49) TaxID=508771 RepID=S8GFC5_TOXGM|nr:hypothetical protein TGME49_244230 [Toxoplasma gondii ME49]EPT30545.1 hypothetical protein TGME49_244230 [Toxoplasma gondii ME49]|eukprot:XP_002366912.1 hypothetical protein TGME49_244230 [Toxoplasma gondii ME49]